MRDRVAIKDKSEVTKAKTGTEAAELAEQELRNLEKQVQAAEAEYVKQKARIEQISDPQYLAELKEKIVTLTHKSKKLEKNRRHLESVRKLQDRAALAETEPDLLPASGLSNELSALDDRMKEWDGKISRQAQTLQEQSAKLADVRAGWKHVSDDAIMQGVDPNDRADGKARQKADPVSDLEAQRVAIEKTLNLLRTRHTVTSAEYAQKKAALQAQVNGVAVSVREKIEYGSMI